MTFWNLEFARSTRHSKIAGDFGEALVLYWLSKHGYECALIDHTGIDIIATDPKTGEVLGISVKCRSRSPGSERRALDTKKSDYEKIEAACKAFRCKPYFAIVIDQQTRVQMFILPLLKLRELAPYGHWKMSRVAVKSYKKNPCVLVVDFEVKSYGQQG